MKIGITLNMGSNLFSSGINQNAFYLASLFCKSGHSLELIVSKRNKDTEHQLSQILDKKQDITIIDITEAHSKKYDVIVILGMSFTRNRILKLKETNPKIKFVKYQCGNQFLIDMEASLFNMHLERFPDETIDKTTDDDDDTRVDAIWQIPQMQSNEGWVSFKQKTDNITVVPFVWDPIFIENVNKEAGYGLYTKDKNLKRIGVMEPNLSVMKNFLIPLAIAERVNKYLPIDKCTVWSSANVKENKRAKQLLLKTELNKQGKLTGEGRHLTPFVLNKYSHLIVSWQWTNPLNYLYFDIAWLGYPIVHNAHLCKDIGYFYNDNNVYEAAEQVIYAINNHANNSENYIKENREKIKRFTKHNPRVVEQYNMLLEDLTSGKFKKYNYDSSTNSINL